MTKEQAIDELSVLCERISDGETVSVFVHDGNYHEALEFAINVLDKLWDIETAINTKHANGVNNNALCTIKYIKQILAEKEADNE